jgi:hypothetical protein
MINKVFERKKTHFCLNWTWIEGLLRLWSFTLKPDLAFLQNVWLSSMVSNWKPFRHSSFPWAMFIKIPQCSDRIIKKKLKNPKFNARNRGNKVCLWNWLFDKIFVTKIIQFPDQRSLLNDGTTFDNKKKFCTATSLEFPNKSVTVNRTQKCCSTLFWAIKWKYKKIAQKYKSYFYSLAWVLLKQTNKKRPTGILRG